MNALTPKQRELLDFIVSYQGEKRYSPTFLEMRDALGLKAKSGVHRLITALERRGFITRLDNRTRAIEVLAKPHLPNRRLREIESWEIADELRSRGWTVTP